MKAINHLNGNGNGNRLASNNCSTQQSPGLYQIELSEQEFFIFEALQLLEDAEYKSARRASSHGNFKDARGHIRTAHAIIDFAEKLNNEIDFY